MFSISLHPLKFKNLSVQTVTHFQFLCKEKNSKNLKITEKMLQK